MWLVYLFLSWSVIVGVFQYATVLLYIAFSMLTCVILLLLFQDFYHEVMLNFVKGFFCIYWDDYAIFAFYSVYVVYYICWFLYVEASLHSWNETTLITVCCWTQFVNVYGEFLCLYSSRKLVYTILFFVVSLTSFGIRAILAFLPFLFCGIVWEALVLVLSRISMIEFSSESIQFWASLLKDFITASISLLVIDLFKLFISSWFNFCRSYTSRNWFISSRVLSLLKYEFFKYSLMTFWISLVFVVILPFSSLHLLIWIFFLFILFTLARGCQSCLFFHRTNSLSHWFFDSFF
jgi:hypothetical protein